MRCFGGQLLVSVLFVAVLIFLVVIYLRIYRMYIPNPLCHHHFARTKVSKLKYSKAAISTKQPVE